MRLIDQLGVFLARLMRRVESGELAEAKDDTEAASKKLVGLPLAVIENNPADALEALLATAVGPDYPRIMAAAIILDVRGQVAYREADEISAFRFWTTAAQLLITAARSLDEEIRDRSCTQVEEITRHLTQYEIPAGLNLALAQHYETLGEFSRAEDHLYDGLEDSAERNKKCLAFYERIEPLSDAELEAGGLAREEVRQSLADLRHGGGRF